MIHNLLERVEINSLYPKCFDEDNDNWTQVTCLYELEGYEDCGYV